MTLKLRNGRGFTRAKIRLVISLYPGAKLINHPSNPHKTKLSNFPIFAAVNIYIEKT